MAMKTNIVAPAGGILILIGGLALAFYTGTSGSALEAAHAKAVDRYVSLAEKSLSGGDAHQAEKYVKEALVVDPKNKKAISEFKKIILASCPKVAAVAPSATAGAASATPAAKPAAAPAKPQADSEEEMGCI